MCICWFYKWEMELNLQFSQNARKVLTSWSTVSFWRTAVLHELVTNFECENSTNPRFLYMSIYWVSSSVTSSVQQAPGVCELEVAFSRYSLTHFVVISFVCSLSRRGIVHCETCSLEHACTTPGVSVMHRSRSDGPGHDTAQLSDSVSLKTDPVLL
jgi:hypothetical protein